MKREPLAEDKALDFETTIQKEWPRNLPGRLETGDYIYLNNGSCGLKPASVLEALAHGWQSLNENPTIYTFTDHTPWDRARQAAGRALDIEPERIILAPNSTWGLDLVVQSFIEKPGDELVTTDHEHGCVNTLARYLAETRGVSVSKASPRAEEGSEGLTRRILELVSPKTKLVLVSEIDCYTGWRPDLSKLARELERLRIPLLVDGAHVAGQGPASPRNYPFWVTSGHKWWCGPNSTGLVYVREDFTDRLKPLTIGDRYYADNAHPLHKFEWSGTTDVVRWSGLARAIELQLELGQDDIRKRQQELVSYLRSRLGELPGWTIRTPEIATESSAMLTAFRTRTDTVTDLRQYLWDRHRIWTQPDYIANEPGNGMRISCHIYVTRKDIDCLIEALAACGRS